MDKKIDINMIGKYLKSLRLKKGWSQAKLENITGISASTISNIETGNKGANYHISIQTIITMAYALDITFMQLLSESGFLLALGEEKYKSNKAEIYISNHELINIFNPGSVTIGGWLSVAEEYLLLPVRTAINKHSLNIVNKDSVIRFSKLGKKAGPIGACMLSRSRLLGVLD